MSSLAFALGPRARVCDHVFRGIMLGMALTFLLACSPGEVSSSSSEEALISSAATRGLLSRAGGVRCSTVDADIHASCAFNASR